MRRFVSLTVLAAALGVPAVSANATYCPGEVLSTVCAIRCDIHTRLGMGCPR
jgi:hypothetical protein